MIISKEERELGKKNTVRHYKLYGMPVPILNLLEELKCRTQASKKDLVTYGIIVMARRCGIKTPKFKGRGRVMATVKKRLKKEIYD
jgi:hypothetical protein